jgi:FkbH-like protein
VISPAEAARRRERGLALAGAEGAERPPLSVAVLGTFNLDLLPPYLVEALDRAGVSAAIDPAPTGGLAEAIADAGSPLYTAKPDAVVLVPAAEDLLAALWRGAAASGELAAERLDELERLLATVLERLPETTCYVVAFGAPEPPLPSVLDSLAPERGQLEVEEFLRGVRRLGRLSPRVVVVDSGWSGGGAPPYRDARLWYLARMRLAPTGLAALADALAAHVAAAAGRARKVLAVDLDNVLWGGVVGEVGLAGIVLGDDGLGLAYQDLQRELVKLSRTGVLLAVCSKNDARDVDAVFDRHSAMVLRRDDFAALRASWDDKASSLRALAEELGVGLDAFVFLDDEPVEREWVRAALPEVAVPELPGDPTERPAFVRQAPEFRRLSVTAEDAARGDAYARERLRSEARRGVASLDDFLAQLEQRVVIEALEEASLGRAAQLAQRTNQFNLTNERYTVASLAALVDDPAYEAYTLALSDRFGDSGITGLAVLRFAAPAAEVEALMLSCRVLGRRVEDAFLAFLAGRARERGARWLVGRYVRSDRNERARRFYSDHGFDGRDGVYRLDLERRPPKAPAAIAVQAVSRA